MSSPFSGIVMGGGALLASPALHAAFIEGTMPMETALVRLVAAIAVTWFGTSLLEALLQRTAPPPARAEPEALPPGPILARPVKPAGPIIPDVSDAPKLS